MRIEQLYEVYRQSSGICTDTRKIQPNCLFVALRGPNFNGNEYAQEALDKGAYKVILDDLRFHKNTGETICHGDSLKLLQKLATYHRGQLGIPIISLTGSNGKTTTKELIHLVLAKKFNTQATQGNLNNHIGVPLTLLAMNEKTELGVVEMGANHQGEIAALSEIALPDFGYITNFGKAHLEGFGGEEGVIKGKSELYRHLAARNKKVFVNGNDPKQLELTEGMDRFVFGPDDSDCPIQLLEHQHGLKIKYRQLLIQPHLTGVYNFHNIAAAIAMGHILGIEPEAIKEAIETYMPDNNRSQLTEIKGRKVFKDAYNANPSSMVVAIDNFVQMTSTPRILILGDMFELGEDAAKEHQEIANKAGSLRDTTVFLVGEHFDRVKAEEHMHQFSTYSDLEEYLQNNELAPGPLMIKGSRGMALERVLELL
ncbi:UDP-N-acetylmuramoyl-tripeptide--D-alanyl-D-alanine ligase [Aureitalea marina]|uniref:UDP-N-acetylmuramoyl-tripeptide--D-alanyl-D-alanine ligase n=1 Tax=Aureitalea marina TaxID=930804 RepID=A0A2S7KQX3_9FLAO|nr:UDP-N-acetylmuramoyl-tripeptide--D-alanyl-D-alanine ligase [Aureitalea marina]PQB04988.1 UDP-N-acetylmuramoyl-tripeptide--D-alanyl-D-alanine ligase [Aureitalea marina]